jgi:hypothetical protein
VLIQAGPGGFSDGGTIDVSGGPGGIDGGQPGAAGVVTLSAVPEPSGLVLLGTGVGGLLVCGAWRRARPRT